MSELMTAALTPLPLSTADSPNFNYSLESYNFPFSEQWIADRPANPRDSSRLLVLDRKNDRVIHQHFRDLPQFLRPGDCLALNRTKVWSARLTGRKSTGGKVEMLLVREIEPGFWTALSSDVKPGVRVEFVENYNTVIERLNGDGEWECRFSNPNVHGFMSRHGLAPLPPYILKKRRQQENVPLPSALTSVRADASGDAQTYQTVFAQDEGSIAAPTAGLHFTPELLQTLRQGSVQIAGITLHVGHGTFKPITSADVREHRMKSERYRITPDAVDVLEKTKRTGGRIIAVGTTVTRTLETFTRTGHREGWTDLYIHPGYSFQRIDSLITNFHLPQSTPLLLACAFAGKERLLAAYQEAISRQYRFYSYGDAMLII